MQKRPQIIAVIGTHGTGKTTTAFELAKQAKLDHLGLKVGFLSENCIECPYPINKETTAQAQSWIFSSQMQNELTMLARYDLVVSDRSLLDSIAYTRVAGFDGLAQSMSDMLLALGWNYKRLIFKTAANNDYVQDDGLREHKDQAFRLKVEQHLLQVCEDTGLMHRVEKW